MAAGSYDITIEQGATFSLTLTWLDEDSNPINLSGYTARMQIRRTVKDSSTLLSLTTENGRITLGGGAGTIILSASAADTQALVYPSAVYDLELVAAGGTVTRLLQGDVTISPEVTR